MYLYIGHAAHMNTHMHIYLRITPGLTYFRTLYDFICSDMQALTFKSDQLLLGFPNIHAKPASTMTCMIVIVDKFPLSIIFFYSFRLNKDILEHTNPFRDARQNNNV